MSLHQHLHMRKTITFDLMEIRTLDGFLKRSYTEKVQPVFKEYLHSSRKRLEEEDYGVVNFVLSGHTQRFERVYPNFIQLISDCGGIIEVIFFTFNIFGFFHHFVFMDLQIINKAILSGNKQESTDSDSKEPEKSQKNSSKVDIHTREFSYWEVFRFKLFPCVNKNSKRAGQFKQILKILAERMDIGSMVTNCGNVNLLSNVLLEPYQMKIISHFKRSN